MKRSKFSLSNYKLMSMNMGPLYPCNITEVLPGDSVQQVTSALVRASPLLAPVMHPVHVKIHHWFVPTRILWDEFEDFITGGPTGNDTSEYPTIALTSAGTNLPGGLPDYFGIPPGIDLEVSALPFRAYNLIFNEWYRDQDLVSEVAISTASGADTTTDVQLLSGAWAKDYFTASRPFEQKGPSVNVPLIGDAADVFVNAATNETVGLRNANGDMRAMNAGNAQVELAGSSPSVPEARRLQTDLSSAGAVNVTELREALALQRYEEARARYGSRYTEYLRYLGVRSSDARLQRPEYLGGGKDTIQFSEVLTTFENAEVATGELRGHGIAAARSNRYRRFIEEHGYIVSMITVKPISIYAQSLSRLWSRRIKEDYWQKELQHIGQQEILNKEIKADHIDPEGVFGYADRYAEYRQTFSTIAGEFRQTELDFWHFARIFDTDPALNGDFVTCTPTERPFAVPSTDVLYVMANHSIQARRLVSQKTNSFIY